MAKIKITETVLRDSHQSLIATRMTTEDMLPILEKMDKVGYYSLEAWGGATFDACMRFLNEDPWERLRAIRARVKNTKLHTHSLFVALLRRYCLAEIRLCLSSVHIISTREGSEYRVTRAVSEVLGVNYMKGFGVGLPSLDALYSLTVHFNIETA